MFNKKVFILSLLSIATIFPSSRTQSNTPLICSEKLTIHGNEDITITEEKRFVIIIPSYNNECWCIQNIESAVHQGYNPNKFRVIFIDDCSRDNNYNLVKNYVEQNNLESRVTLIRNKQRIGGCANIHRAVHMCDDDEICLILDGDDWFPDATVLTFLNKVYQEDVWMTYGQYIT
ncbi:unnamed protein product, partial [marine sediment metagenome]